MKLLISIIALTGLTALTTASALPPQPCSIEDQLKCATLPIPRDAILHCWRGIWRTTALCPPHHTCESKPIPHCIYPGGAVAEIDARAAEGNDPAVEDIEVRIPKICDQDQLRCFAFTPEGASFIQRCDNNRWHAVTICNAEEKCDSAPSPHCVRKSGAEVDTRAAEIEASEAEANELPCVKCRKFKERCVNGCKGHRHCVETCSAKMRAFLVEDGAHGRYKGTCAYYCPKLE